MMAEQAKLNGELGRLIMTARKIREVLITEQPHTLLGRAIGNSGPELIEEYVNELDGIAAMIRETCFPTDGTAEGEK